MTDLSDESLEAAARATYAANPAFIKYYSIFGDEAGELPAEVAPWFAAPEWEQQKARVIAETAIRAYLTAERAQGRAMMPERPSEEMKRHGAPLIGAGLGMGMQYAEACWHGMFAQHLRESEDAQNEMRPVISTRLTRK